MKSLKFIYFLPALAILSSCSQDNPNELDEIESSELTEVSVDEEIELASPEKGSLTEVYYAGQKLPVEELNGEYVYQGDILLSPDMVSNQEVKLVYEEGEVPQNKSVGRTSGFWPNNTVYYAIDGNLSNQARVHDAIAHWEAKTNLKFVKRTNQANYINFVTGSGCSSYVGMIGGKQNITLSTSCSTGNTIHEIGHAIGLWHEQSRVDRDKFITINYSNIQSGREHNFHTYAQQRMDGMEYTSSLDFESLMMYGSYSFSSNGKPTMVKKNGSTFNVQRSGLSSGDITGVNNMYPYTSGSNNKTEPIYTNGKTYVLYGVTVYRSNDRWLWYSRVNGWREVYARGSYWFFK